MNGEEIARKAVELGYESCGIIKIEEILDYADRLDERIRRTPENAEKYSALYRYVKLQESYPWAKSIVVCVRRYGKYRIPSNLKGLVAKYYLADGRKDENSPDYQASVAFENHLHAIGLKTETERKFGITALRWAAMKAGLGIVRRNNFFYADCGSWLNLEAWLIDREIVLKQENTHRPCPPTCSRCIDACPTKSLREPYTMSRASCISCLTTWDGDDLTTEPHNREIGAWIYGCDACQDVCPFNAEAWEDNEEYPGLSALAELIDLEQIVTMDYETLLTRLHPKFFYVGKDRIWKWKTNALNAMRNAYDPKYNAAIQAAFDDEYEQVRKTARWVMDCVGGADKAD